MESSSIESRTILAIEVLKKDPKFSVRRAAKIYEIPEATLRHRRVGRLARRDMPASSRALTDLEEDVIVQRILDLDSRGFQPRQGDVREIVIYV